MLVYGIKVATSLISTALGDYSAGRVYAEEAITCVSERNLPKVTHSWSWLAKGMAYAEGVTKAGQVSEIGDAERALIHHVIEEETARVTDRAAAHLHLSRLYSRIDQPFKATVFYERAAQLVEDSEHGWTKELREITGKLLRESLSSTFTLDIQELLDRAKKEKIPALPYIEKLVDTQIKRRLIWLQQDTLHDEDGAGKLARELGVTRTTIFNWKKDPTLRDVFPKNPRR
jgi:hypothetical protein